MELPVSETVYRLSDPGELAVDVGAHIGHMTSIMACRVGLTGKVLSFEPHPLTFIELASNVERWAREPGIAEISIQPVALSDAGGDGILDVPGDDAVNRALASVGQISTGVGTSYPIKISTLSEFLHEGDLVGVMKLDVEGREHAVLMGSQTAIHKHAIRDIVFEEYKPYPNSTTAFVEQAGYTVFSVGISLRGPVLALANTKPATRSGYIPTYLATHDPDRALLRMAKRGWAVLRPDSFKRQR
jgi:FkbM family methyltransferase